LLASHIKFGFLSGLLGNYFLFHKSILKILFSLGLIYEWKLLVYFNRLLIHWLRGFLGKDILLLRTCVNLLGVIRALFLISCSHSSVLSLFLSRVFFKFFQFNYFFAESTHTFSHLKIENINKSSFGCNSPLIFPNQRFKFDLFQTIISPEINTDQS